MYKTILLHVDNTPASAARLAVAAQLALRHDAHLIGVALTGLAPFIIPVGAPEPGLAAVSFPLEQLHAEAERALDAFEAATRQAGVSSIERRLVDDEVGGGLALQARYADLVVLSQVRPGHALDHLLQQVPGQVLLGGGRPVLLLPAASANAAAAPPAAAIPGRRILVAWNGSINAARAISSALPLLVAAEQVSLVVCRNGDDNAQAADVGSDMALYLARHGATVEVSAIDEAAAAALLGFAASEDIDLIVMGAYGRTRFRELLLGGVTRTLLRESTVPLWMAH